MCHERPPISVVLTFDPAEMARRGRLGAQVTHARHDPHSLTAAARAAFLARFEQEVDPDGVLPDPERLRRARQALRRHMTRLALQSAEARRGGVQAVDPDEEGASGDA
jgi:hypothetical protein